MENHKPRLLSGSFYTHDALANYSHNVLHSNQTESMNINSVVIFDNVLEIEFYGIAYVVLVLTLNMALSIFFPRIIIRECIRTSYSSAIEAALWVTLPKRALLAIPFSVMVVLPRFGQCRGFSGAAKHTPDWQNIVCYLNFYL